MEPSKDRVYEIEKMAELKQSKNDGVQELSFDNSGNIVVNNRKYRRNFKRLWRAVVEGRKSIHWYTRKHNKAVKARRKLERQNRKKGRK